jgi:hypothetical protein
MNTVVAVCCTWLQYQYCHCTLQVSSGTKDCSAQAAGALVVCDFFHTFLHSSSTSSCITRGLRPGMVGFVIELGQMVGLWRFL